MSPMSSDCQINSKESDPHDSAKSLPSEKVTVAEVTFKILDDYVQPPKLSSRPVSYYRYVEKTPEELYEQVEYDMDEEDCAWLELVNEQRTKMNLGQISMDTFEQLMDRFEKESFFQCQSESKVPNAQADEDAVCAVCLDGECYNNDVILFCDLCDLAVHQKCYGVPSIPDGSWVCQRCLLSPSKTVECCLCPNRRGAFKQTDDGRWVHVACAMWIPEVDFANPTFLEPVIGIGSIASARWKLVCYVCRQRSAGACVQCAHPSCYTGFHVTCAQQAGLNMAKDQVKDIDQGSGTFVLTKTVAFCDVHSESFTKKPDDQDDKARHSSSVDVTESKNQLALRKARKILADNRVACLPLFYPVITVSSIAKISRKISIEQREAFISRLHCYWTLKRQSRNGMPLLRSRQFGNFHRVVFKNAAANESAKENAVPRPERGVAVDSALALKMKECHRLRQDLEKVRLLIEQVRKREKLKSEEMRLYEQETMLRLNPLVILYLNAANRLNELLNSFQMDSDIVEFGNETLQKSELFLKIRQKIENHEYRSFQTFEADLNCLCLDSSERGTDENEQVRQQFMAIVDILHKDLDRIEYDQETGLHLSRPTIEIASHETTSSTFEKSPSLSILEFPDASRNISRQSSISRGRGRGKRKAGEVSMEDASNASKSSVLQGANIELNEIKVASGGLGSAEKLSSSVAPSGVNRRTAVLFSNKTRKSAKHCEISSGASAISAAKDAKPHRRPGRPPKLSGHKYGHESDSGGTRDRPFMLNKDCIGFGDSELVEKSAESQSSDFAKIVDSGAEGGAIMGDCSLEAVAQGRQSFMQYRGNLQDAKTPKSSNAMSLASEGSVREGDVHSRRSMEAGSKESFLQYRNMSMSNSDAESHSDEESSLSSSASSSQSDGESTSTQESSADSDVDCADSEQVTSGGENLGVTALKPLSVVWAKCRGYPWYPALIIDPKTSCGDTFENGVPIPVPPEELLKLQKKHSKPMILVLFFDAKRTWQWLPPNKLQLLGENNARDRAKLSDNKKPNVRKAMQNAYDKAIQHKSLVSVETASSSIQDDMDTT